MKTTSVFYNCFKNTTFEVTTGNFMTEKTNINNSYRPEDIFDKYYQALCYFAFQYVGNDEIAEDVVQDLFTTIIENPKKFDSPSHLRNFLYQSVKNSCLNYLKKNKSHDRYLEFMKNTSQDEEDYERKIIATEIYKELKLVIESLPSECKKVYELSYFQGKDNNSIAEELGVSINTVKAQKARGKKILKERLKDLYPIFLLLWEMYGR